MFLKPGVVDLDICNNYLSKIYQVKFEISKVYVSECKDIGIRKFEFQTSNQFL